MERTPVEKVDVNKPSGHGRGEGSGGKEDCGGM